MTARLARWGLIAALGALAACGDAGTEPAPGKQSTDEAKALAEAEAMLAERPAPEPPSPKAVTAP